MTYKTLKDFDVNGKRVILRADLNVPRSGGKITDTTRIDRLKPTIDYLRTHGAKILILSHFGRPDGAVNSQMSLAFLVDTLQQHWGADVSFARDCIDAPAKTVINDLQNGDIALLENVRFHTGEKTNDPAFAAALAALGDIYINDAFSAAHRAHASTDGITAHIPSGAGLLMEAELNALTQALEKPETPVVAIVGGSKISTKLSVLHNLMNKVDVLIPGGAMANTFLYAGGHSLGTSMLEDEMADEARSIMAAAKKRGCKILLPVDCTVVKTLKSGADFAHVDADKIPADQMVIDIGPKTALLINDTLEHAKTLVWNGPLGVFEIKPFDAGTNAIAKKAATLTKARKLKSIAGGGDTVAALENADAADDFTYISTAGGAFLEWLEGKDLPGVMALVKSA